jgi:hypothetical protein
LTVDCGKAIPVNHSVAYPAHLFFLDTETRPVQSGKYTKHLFRLGWTRDLRVSKDGATESDRWVHHKTALSVLREIEAATREKTALTVYGHNLWFDLQVCGFFHQFPKWGWILDFVYDEGLTYLLTVRNGNRSIRCVSTTNYFDFSLAILGQEIGLPKLGISFSESSLQALATYCKRDTEITAESVLKYIGFVKSHDSGRFAFTKASQAMNSYRHRFMGERIFVHKAEDVQALERQAYFGGRTECFQLGTVKRGPFVFLDINSMYPAVMRAHTFPNKLLEWHPKADLALLGRWIGRAACVASVTVETDSPAYPVRMNGKSIFPVGRFDTFLCSGGLERAWKLGEIKACSALAVYSRAPIFRRYVDYWYPLKAQYKAEGNAVYTRMVKLFLNSLYGKFGERRFDEEWEEDWSGEDPWRRDCFSEATGERWVEQHLFNVTITRGDQVEGPRSCVAIAAHVTEYARLLLWDIIETTGRKNVLYCDTDSIVVREAALGFIRHPIDAKLLGSLSVDRTTARLTLHGCKDYEIDQGCTIKGIPKRSTKLAGGRYGYDQFLGSASHLRIGGGPGVLTEPRVKVLAREYDKGEIGRGGRVTPFHLGGS